MEKEEKLEKESMYRHSMAHILAKAVKELYPNCKLAIGPAIDNGFYYDFDDVAISSDDFEKIELKVGTVINSEKVEKSDKLLKNTIKIGNEVRTIVSGIAEYYLPEQIIGKQVVVVTNLAPRKIRGIESNGMVLCAFNDETKQLCVISPEKPVEDGIEVG